MALKNAQFEQILRIYDDRRLSNKAIHDARIQEIHQRIPAFAALDASLAERSVAFAKASIGLSDEAYAKARSAYHLEQAAIIARKTALLKENGYPEDYLAPLYSCPDCKDTGYLDGGTRCHCLNQTIIDTFYQRAELVNKWQQETFDHFQLNWYDDTVMDPQTGLTARAAAERALDTCRSFVSHFRDSHENLLLYGVTGVGKTFLSNCIAGALAADGVSVIYQTAFELFDALEKITFRRGEENDLPSALDLFLSCDLLIIDDLGTELANAFTTSRLYLLINERRLREKATVISSNLSLAEIQRTYSDRIFSRIISDYRIVHLLGDDIRYKKATASPM